ncbi:MAG TPA: ABC transporter permease [Myxococcaceae bacterium]|nr:ABC transporter permease [Myxococcaceae bacterium]
MISRNKGALIFKVDVLEGAKIALRSLGTNRLRTLLTTGGIAIGVATLLAIVGIIQGLNASFERQLATMGTNSVYIAKRKFGAGSDEWQEARQRKDVTADQMSAVKNECTYCTAVAPNIWFQADVSFLSSTINGVQLIGTTEEYIDVSSYHLSKGRFLAFSDDADQKSVVVLAADIAESLFPSSDPIGATVRIDDHPFRVIGTLERRGKFMDANWDKAVVLPLRTLRGYWGAGKSLTLIVGVDKADNMDRAVDQLTGIMRRARKTPAARPDDFAINRPDQLLDLYKKLTGALYGVIMGIGLITLIVGGIGIMNIMLVSVRERTREIGVRRALGARRRTIVLQFLMEAMAVSGVGGAIGTAVGLSGAKIISLVTPLAASVEVGTIFFGVGFAAMVGLLFGIWPAARAANLDPVEALRYE